MKCDICRERPAVIFVQQVSKDSSIELHLCEECARARGLSTADSRIDISLGSIFSGLLENQEREDQKTVACPSCGISLSEIKKRHRTGCADCYNQFRGEIVSILRSEGVTISFSGTLPAKGEPLTPAKTDPSYLRHELQLAIENENYELAAYYRDRLKALGETR
jgi:protein arginine kinase activator